MAYRLPVAAFSDAVRLHGDETALAFGEERWTYGQFESAVAAAVSEFAHLGPGSRVELAPEPADLLSVTRLWAAWRRGLVAAVHEPTSAVGPGPETRSSATAAARRVPGPAVEITAADDMCLVPTSGSTGRPKLVRLTHGNVAAAVAASRQRLGNGAGEAWLLCLPLSHVAGLSVLWRTVDAGGSVLLHPGFDPAAVANSLLRGDVAWVSLVPTMLGRMLAAEPGPYPSSIRGVLLGGAPAPAGLVGRGLDAGLPILTTYGLTEACSQVATVAPGEQRFSVGTVGRPLPGMAVTIAEVGGEAPGRIAVDGPAVSPGYEGEEPRSGPLVTGDLGRFDPDGRLLVVGRADDVIITGGEKVAPAVVEAALLAHPGVRAAVVYGVDDDDWGQLVTAAVVAPDVDAAQLVGHLRDRVRRFEVPKLWLWLDELPVLPNGKVDVPRLVALHRTS